MSPPDAMRTPPPVSAEVPRFLRLKLYGPIVALVVFVLLAWIPHFIKLQFPKWPDPYRPISVINQTFHNREVLLDGFSYDHCTFENVTFVYNGTTALQMVFPDIKGSVTFRSENVAVEGTMALLKGMGYLPDVNIRFSNPNNILRAPGEPVE